MRPKLPISCVVLAALAVISGPAGGAYAQQRDRAPVAEQDQSEEIVVTARRSGAPMWEVRSDGATVLLVGEISDIPKETPWRPLRLEAATAGAQYVILGTRAKISPGDIFRLLLRGQKLKRLPNGRSVADYLSPAQMRRLRAIERRTGGGYEGQSLLVTAFDLLTKELAFNKNTTDVATDVVRRAARRSRIPTQPVGTVRGEDLLDSLFGAAPQTHVACLDAAMNAYDDGREGVLRRGRDWTEFNVPGVMASPLETSLGRCWPWTDGQFADLLRQQWSQAVQDALARPGVTMAVVPLRVLAERGGVLDRLDARGLPINGPAWRANAGPRRP